LGQNYIQEVYDTIQHPNTVHDILKIAFPLGYQDRDKSKFNEIVASGIK